jgi:tRNA-Thr(GGU) m(6)t(6)A37 methyltransferase TsaA
MERRTMTKNITLTPIGVVSSQVVDLVDEGWGDIVARVFLKPEYCGGLRGLEAFSHVLVVSFLHHAGYDPSRHLRRRPRGWAHMPELGIFAQRVKDRPNPLGISAVRLLDVGRDGITIRGLDAVNGTPVLDIKPYVPHFDRVDKPMVPAWVDDLMARYF